RFGGNLTIEEPGTGGPRPFHELALVWTALCLGGHDGRVLEDVVHARHRGLEGAKLAELHISAILVKLLRSVGELAVENIIPFDSGSAVGGLAAHDGR